MSKELHAIKKELLIRKSELEEKLARMAREKVTDDVVKDPGDQALSSTMETLKTSFQNSEIGEYNRIVKALEKIEDGVYGICVECNKPISEKRLKSFSNAARCLICQETFEEKKEMPM